MAAGMTVEPDRVVDIKIILDDIDNSARLVEEYLEEDLLKLNRRLTNSDLRKLLDLLDDNCQIFFLQTYSCPPLYD